jgi:uncharacterized protein (UPF0335 family)
MAAYDPYAPRNPAKERDALQDAIDEVKRDSGERRARAARQNGVASDQLRAFVERVERLEEEKKTIADDIKSVFGEAKSVGFDVKVLRRVIAIRKQDPAQRMEFEAVLDTYLAALGMIGEGV